MTKVSRPIHSNIPDLSSLNRQNSITYLLKHVLTGTGPKSYRSQVWLQAFVRMADKAVEDYELARLAFESYVSGGNAPSIIAELLRAVGHMENCLYSMERALKFVRRMSQDEHLRSVIPEIGVLKEGARKCLSKIRNAIEHLDERVVRGTIPEGALTTMLMDEDHLELQGTKLTYEQLAEWIRELQSLAVALTDFRSPS